MEFLVFLRRVDLVQVLGPEWLSTLLRRDLRPPPATVPALLRGPWCECVEFLRELVLLLGIAV